MVVAGAVTIYTNPMGDAGYAPPRGPRGDSARDNVHNLPPRDPRGAARPDSRNGRSAAILDFSNRVKLHLATGCAFHAAAESHLPLVGTFATAPTGAFLAQHIAQERLGDGLTLDPYAQAAAAYARTRGLASAGPHGRLDIAI